jgi:hypothetical protein
LFLLAFCGTPKRQENLTFRKKSNTHKNHNLSFSSTELHIYLERKLKSRKWSQDGGNWRGMLKSYWLDVCSSPFLLFLSARLTQSWATSVPKFCQYFKVTEPGNDNSIFLAVPAWLVLQQFLPSTWAGTNLRVKVYLRLLPSFAFYTYVHITHGLWRKKTETFLNFIYLINTFTSTQYITHKTKCSTFIHLVSSW